MKIKLEYESGESTQIIDMNTLPPIGERLVASETLEVVRVVHTPWNAEHDAILTVRPVEE